MEERVMTEQIEQKLATHPNLLKLFNHSIDARKGNLK